LSDTIKPTTPELLLIASMSNQTLIIAEAGVNHNGNIELAKRLVEVASEASADWVKFQTFNADRLVTSSSKKAEYQIRNTGNALSQHQMLRNLELSSEMHQSIISHCRLHKIGFFSTAFDIENLDFLVSLGLNSFKIPSGEITNLPYLQHIGRFGKEIFLSTGMADLGEIEEAINILEESGTPRAQITVMHCTTEYPTPMIEVNLRAMQNIGSAFGVQVGYSDHSPGIEVSLAAVALGATVIEKHFTLDRNLPGPDHKASLEPAELKALVEAIRNIEKALGDGIKRPTASELRNRPVARKSLVAARCIKCGEAFGVDNITAKRPGTGISPMRLNEIIGRQASRDFSADELIVL
jgi:N,N'-diacetyllegionaminate synthase